MNNEFSRVGLYNHNAQSYEKVREAFSKQDVVGIVHATGTGKSYNALQLALDNKDKRTIYVVPSNGIIEHIKKIIDNNPNLDMERDFPNLEFRTYHSFVNMSRKEISQIDMDLLILDEFHHIGAPIWGERIDTLIDTHPNAKIFGMTAYTVRDRGTSYERDMANPDNDGLFSNNIVSRYDLCDAMIDGVIPKPIYKSAYVKLEGVVAELEKRINKLDSSTKEYQEYMNIILDIKRRISQAPSMTDVVKGNTKSDGKYIYFCPPSASEGVNDMKTIMAEAKEWFLSKGIKEEDIVFYNTTSNMGDEGRSNREAFYNDRGLDGTSADGKLRVMFAINQYNEGVHAPNVDGVIMGRGTTSDIVYFEQLGRALSVRGNTKEDYEKYERYTYEQLLMLCKERDIFIKVGTSKEEVIEKLIAPVIIDLTNNFEFIKELETNLKNKVKEIQEKGPGNKRIVKLGDTSFDIDVLNVDLYEMLSNLKDRLTITWEDMYEYAKKYYEHHGNLEVPQKFRTNNGYERDENGIISLGSWIHTQRNRVEEGSERWQLLSKVGMRFENKFLSWEETYEYAKKYYEHHGDLEVPYKFRTNNGYERDENGIISLGSWINNQRDRLEEGSERWQLLCKIGMRFENKRLSWEEMYEYAKVYYEYHGNLEVPQKFRTNNGYERDENGIISLGWWINHQRNKVEKGSEKWQLLNKIGMCFDNKYMSWEETYEYAKKYYEHHGHLKVLAIFRTNNGYEHDENGKISLGRWINNQRDRLEEGSERWQLLSKIGMIWDVKKNTNEVKDICRQYGIDFKNNKNILEHMSVQELMSKILFLQDNNINYVEETGKLHEIFPMSSVNMKNKYGVNLEELVTMYYIDKNKGKGV